MTKKDSGFSLLELLIIVAIILIIATICGSQPAAVASGRQRVGCGGEPQNDQHC
jgi:prepilin-type N-terminal cleavage/methylation domain-containing protein